MENQPFKIAVFGSCQAFDENGAACKLPAITINFNGYAVCSQHYQMEPTEVQHQEKVQIEEFEHRLIESAQPELF